mgnify:CR=1 FL=1
MRNLIILAKWLAARAQVDVVECNGSTAWIELVNGRRVINIPSSWNYSNDPDAQALLEGIMDHEALGHGRFTDLEAKAKAQDQKLIEFNALSSAIWNTLEDVFIERRSIETYPGVKHNLARTMAILSGRGFFGNADQFAACASKIHLLRAGLLNCLRHALVPGQAEVFQRNVDALGPLLQKELGSLWNDVMAVAARVVDSTCTMDNIKLTIEIMGLLEEASQEPNDSGADDQDQQASDGIATDEFGSTVHRAEKVRFLAQLFAALFGGFLVDHASVQVGDSSSEWPLPYLAGRDQARRLTQKSQEAIRV